MTLVTVVIKNLRRRPGRTGLTVAGIAIGIGAVVALTSIAGGFAKSWVRIYTARGTDLIVTKSGSLSPSPPPFAADQLDALAAMPGVERTSGVMSELMGVEEAPIVLIFGWESRTFVWDHLRLVSGRWPSGDAERAVVLGTLAVDVLKKTVGSPIQIGTTTYTVCGIADSGSLIEKGAIVMTLAQLQRLTEQPGKINFLNLKLSPGISAADTSMLRRAIVTRFPGYKAYTTDEVPENNSAIQAAKAISWATSAIALFVGALSVMNTVLMSVFERVQEIGILLAVGWRRSRILTLVLLESVVLSLVGGGVGVAAGTIGVRLLQMVPLLQGKIEGDFSASLFLAAFAISIVLGVLGGLHPAYRASRLQPVDALRHE